jgi:hypothetical protein
VTCVCHGRANDRSQRRRASSANPHWLSSAPRRHGFDQKIMAYCCCLWGGAYNPIIPVFKSTPKDWRDERFERLKGPAIARGYINFFEPDVYVEAEECNPRSCVLRTVTRDKKECSPFRNCTLRCAFYNARIALPAMAMMMAPRAVPMSPIYLADDTGRLGSRRHFGACA